MRRSVVAVLVGVVALVGGAAPAAADPPAPTDFRSEVISVEPATDAVEIGFVGGDNFVEITVVPGHEVEVLGYRGEPYLLVDADGGVFENQRSPSTALNEDRYGRGTIPDDADPAADPEWEQVGSGGYFAWHDHRTHWMNQADPIGSEPGDQILEAVVPLRVDGEDVAVTVGSWWEEPPSPLVTILGMLGGVVLLVAAVRRGQLAHCAYLVGLSIALLVLGIVAYVSVPAITGPDLTLWMLPLLPLVASTAAFAVRDGDDPARAAAARDALVLVGGLLLTWAAWSRWDATTRAIIPSVAPDWLDRFVLGAAFMVGGMSVPIVVRSRWLAVRARAAQPA